LPSIDTVWRAFAKMRQAAAILHAAKQ